MYVPVLVNTQEGLCVEEVFCVLILFSCAPTSFGFLSTCQTATIAGMMV